LAGGWIPPQAAPNTLAATRSFAAVPGVARLGLVLGDLADDLTELRGDGRVRRRDPLVGVEDLVVLAAARREDRDDVGNPGASDVGDASWSWSSVSRSPCSSRRW
jgi:hypothetical protein